MAVGGRSTASPRGGPVDENDISVNFDAPSLTLGVNGSVTFHSSGEGTVSNYSLVLLQLPNDTSSFVVKILDVQTDICITSEGAERCGSGAIVYEASPTALVSQTISLILDGPNGNNTDVPPTALDNVFYCLGPNDGTQDICDFYSSVFNIAVVDGSPPVASFVSFPSAMAVSSTTTAPLLQVHLATTTTTDGNSGPTAASSSLSVTGTSLTTITQTPTTSPTASASPITSHSSSSKLSTGAKVGIALGALAFISLLLLAALFLLRKKHASRKTLSSSQTHPHQPEQVMLTRDMHTDSFSRNLTMLEKDRGNPSSTITTTHTHDADTPLESTSPSTIQRHSAISPYEPISSSSGPTAIAANNNNNNIIPRRKPTNTNTATTSPTATSASPHTPPSEETFEAYHDVPIYGDARHVPQVFSSTPERGVVSSPFLGEETEGMSPEEVARLEEEERRIDAAIAAAEGR
ncbi:uncharacterized protein LY89DRAFT_728721 [Mollisia scopiformis]|uniref:Mid2 domain-containing protein n=1 Tax=Mollisia scopiformis TaxID=149040 RepID=A0A194XQY7_MOLSC|nr:uncharacterized protein LY89DRAFT_728721 [Mollisia scopiformis]KUJ22598.1 hypothetical protein LY89DRAFT_728721 [Mollisia scopiformis]